MRRLLSLFFMLALLAPANAQSNTNVNWKKTTADPGTVVSPGNPLPIGGGFVQTARTADISATVTTSNVAFGVTANTARVCNAGTVTGYVALGDSTITVTAANGIPVTGGSCINLSAVGYTYIAGITASSTTTLQVSLGSGIASLGGGGSSGGGGSTSPGGVDTNVQFNDSNTFGGTSGFTFNKSNSVTSIVGAGGTTGLLILNSSGAAVPTIPHPNSINIVGADSTFPALYMIGSSLRSVINGIVYGGTTSARTFTLAGAESLRVSGRGYDGTNQTGSQASVSFFAGEDVTPTAQGGWIGFRAAPLGTVAGGSEISPPLAGAITPSGGFVLGKGANYFTTSGANLAFLTSDPGSGYAKLQGGLILDGSSSGTLTQKAPATAGTNTLTWPAGTTDFSATGGAAQVVKQTSSGGAFTVAQLASGDISGLGTSATVNTGTSGSTIPLLSGVNTWSGAQTIASIIGSKIYPASDSTTALQLLKADATTALLNVDTTNGFFGIGTTTPSRTLDIFSAGAGGAVTIGLTSQGNTALVLSRYSNNASAPTLSLNKSRGTIAAPLVAVAGDTGGTWSTTAMDANAGSLRTITSISSLVDAVTGSDNISGKIVFQTRPDGASAALATALTLNKDQSAAFTGAVTGTSLALNGATIGANTIAGIGQFASFGATTTGPGFYSYLNGDTVARVRIGLDANDTPSLAFGPGGATARDVFLMRAAAATGQFGQTDVDTAPVAQTLRTQGTLAGGTSNVAGANWTFIASPGKGTGAGGSFIFQTAPAGSTGTTVNAPVTALTIDSTQRVTVSAGITNTFSGAASLAASLWSGTVLTGGTATTNFPAMFVQPTGTSAVTSWSTSGTGLGMNLASGFAGNFLDFHIAGATSVFSVASSGGINSSGSISGLNSFITAPNGVLRINGDTTLSRSAAATWQLGSADAAAPVAQTLRAQSVVAGTAATNGANLTLIGSLPTGTGTSGDIIIQTGVKTGSGTTQGTATTALTIKGETQALVTAALDASTSAGGALQVAGGASIAKRFWIPAITTSSGLQTAVLCQSSGGEMIADSVACLASSARFKNIHGSLSNDVVDKFMKLPIKIWAYKPEGIFKKGNWTRDRIGPIAEDVERLDPRLVEYDSEGNVRAYSTEQLLAYTIKVVQEQQMQISELKRRVH